MAKETPKGETKVGPMVKTFKVEMPRLPADFREAEYANRVTVSASEQEVFFDLFQVGPEAGGHGEARIVFVRRVIFPLVLAKAVISRLQGLVDSIEKDKGIKLPGPEEVEP